ncbi:5-oxoprolinase subunit PxpB [Aliiglaciecola sp. CAU 1673]|uniref:5-oxoprolinase subunit PxpB n=1 Tax=Aliiglaciecola sp. CAU 1673 TaxID=3032595 RepID=UPI0023D984EE|nr:5-oxoprolinase subunit PxpB [Aliiglaciecola sp. CAU 1673]MDF2176670.1 5-oxoprolinase subunit PxpB [Aliiglaciecola sp. CAU 1673]
MSYPRLQSAGEGALILYLADNPSDSITARLAALIPKLYRALGEDLLELVPSYHSLLILFDPLNIEPRQIRDALMLCLPQTEQANLTAGKLIELPVYYSEESGADLGSLARQAKLSIDEVIALHQQVEYRVYAIGFAPGFAYLGEVDKRIAMPRLATPRKKVPKGAVAIADRQTAVYPDASPGGWNLIGLCPSTLFDPAQDPPMAFSVGDRICFKAIDRQSFLDLGGKL